MTSADTIRTIRDQTDTILLAFSCGKDSVAAWLECRKHFPRIVPFYLYLVPDLEFVEDSLRYYEDFFGTRIARLPSPSLYRMLRNNVFQPPPNWPILDAANLPGFTYLQQEDVFREELGLDAYSYVATGVRAADSIQRRNAIKKTGGINHATRKFLPIWDWKKDRLLAEFESAGCKLPADYRIYARSLDGINYQYLAPMKEHFPRDYARVLEFFPLAELELKRMEYAAKS